MRVAYGDSNVLRCAIQFAYDRFHTTFSYPDVRRQVIGEPDGVVTSKDVVNRADYTNNTSPSLTNSQRNRQNRGVGLRNRGNREAYVNPNPSNNRRGSGARNNR